MLLELAPWAKETLNFRTRFSAESEKVGSKVLGVVAALDVIGGHIGRLSAFLVGDGKVLEDGCTGWPAGCGHRLLCMSKAIMLRDPVTSCSGEGFEVVTKVFIRTTL